MWSNRRGLARLQELIDPAKVVFIDLHFLKKRP